MLIFGVVNKIADEKNSHLSQQNVFEKEIDKAVKILKIKLPIFIIAL